MVPLDSLAVPEADIQSFAFVLDAYREEHRLEGKAADDLDIVREYPDIEYKIGRNIVSVFGQNCYCVEYKGTNPGFTNRRDVFVKNLPRGTSFFKPVWTAAHELCHLFENVPALHRPALEELKLLVRPEALEKRRALEDDDVGYKLKNLFEIQEKIIDRSKERQLYIWKEVMADSYASMWAEPLFWSSVERLLLTEAMAKNVIETIARLREVHANTGIDSYPERVWYPQANRDKVLVLMTDLTASFLARQ